MQAQPRPAGRITRADKMTCDGRWGRSEWILLWGADFPTLNFLDSESVAAWAKIKFGFYCWLAEFSLLWAGSRVLSPRQILCNLAPSASASDRELKWSGIWYRSRRFEMVSAPPMAGNNHQPRSNWRVFTTSSHWKSPVKLKLLKVLKGCYFRFWRRL